MNFGGEGKVTENNVLCFGIVRVCGKGIRRMSFLFGG